MATRKVLIGAIPGGMVVLFSLVAGDVQADVRNNAFFDRLASHVTTTDTLDAPARKIILDAIANRDDDTDDESLAIEALVLMSPEFRDGLDAYDAEDYDTCLAAMDRLRKSPDPYIRQNARAYAIKTLVHTDRLIEAQERLERLLKNIAEWKPYSLDEAEMWYMLGYCQVQNLQYDKANATLRNFLRDYPNASPRFIVTAKQMLAELARRIPESIDEVADLMTFSEKRLAVGDADEHVQEVQGRIVELLDQLIEQAEEQEKNQQAGGGKSKSQRSQQPKSQPEQPMPASKAAPEPARESSKNPGRRVNPGEAWGSMPDAEREKILQVLHDRFPGRYRALVEQYYQSLAEQP